MVEITQLFIMDIGVTCSQMRNTSLLLLLTFLLSPISCLTDLSSSNCPSAFSITTSNTTSSATQSFLASNSVFFKSLRGSANSNRIQNIVLTGDTSDLTKYMMEMAIPFIVVGVAFTIMYCTIILCCIFQKSCPPCQAWKRDFAKRPYQRSELRCVSISFLVFCILVGAVSITAFVFVPELKASGDNTKCGLFRVIDTAINGDSTNSWGGFSTINSLIGNISNTLSTASTQITNYFGDNSWMVNLTTSMQNKNLNLYNSYANSTIYSPDPNNPSVNITPLFISSMVKTNGTPNTLLTSIDTAQQVSQKLTNAGYQLDQSARLLKDSISSLTSNIATAQDSFTMYQSYLTKTQSAVTSFSGAYFDSSFTWGIYVMQGVIGFILAASVLGIIGVVATHFFDIYNCRPMAHVAWAMMGIMYIGVVLLAYAMIPGSIVATDFCSISNSTLYNRTYYRLFGAQYSQNILTKMETCTFDDGQILKTFNIYSEMYTVENVFNLADTYQNMRNSTHPTYVNLSTSTTTVSDWMTAIGKYRDGIYVDANTALTTDANPHVAIKSLNDYTLRATNGQNCTQDDWVFDNTNCTTGEAQYAPGSTPTNALTLTTIPLCISFNSKYQTSSTSSWTVADFQSRYTQILLTCPSSYTIITNYGVSLIRYRDSRISLYQSIYDDLNSLLGVNNNLNTKHATFTTNLTSFRSSVSTLDSLVNDDLSGLQVLSNCAQIANQMRFVNNEFCGNFLATSYKLAICFLLLLGLMIGAVITGSVFAIKYANVQRQAQAILPEGSQARIAADSIIHMERHDQGTDEKSSQAD